MYQPSTRFANAYQEQLLQDVTYPVVRINSSAITWSKTFLLWLGDMLITLGEKVRGEPVCTELSQGQA